MKEKYCFSLETDKKLPWKLGSLPWLPKIVSKPKQWGDLLSETIRRPKGLYSNRRHSSNTGEDDSTRGQRLTVTCTCTEPRLPLPSASPTKGNPAGDFIKVYSDYVFIKIHGTVVSFVNLSSMGLCASRFLELFLLSFYNTSSKNCSKKNTKKARTCVSRKAAEHPSSRRYAPCPWPGDRQ